MLKTGFRKWQDWESRVLCMPEKANLFCTNILMKLFNAPMDSGISISFTTNGTAMDETFIEKSLGKSEWIKVSLNAGFA